MSDNSNNEDDGSDDREKHGIRGGTEFVTELIENIRRDGEGEEEDTDE